MLDAHEPQTFSDRGMLNLVDVAAELCAGIADPYSIIEKRRQPVDRYVGVLIDRRAQRCAVVGVEMLRVVAPAPKEADAQRSLRDDHDCCLSPGARPNGASCPIPPRHLTNSKTVVRVSGIWTTFAIFRV